MQNVSLLFLKISKHALGLTPLFGDRRGFKPAQLKTKTKDPYNGGAPPLLPLPSIFQNQGKTWVLPVLPHIAPLINLALGQNGPTQ